MPELKDTIAEVEDATAAGAQAEIAECEDCKWMMGFEYHCLLGRDPRRCANNPARRGDDELILRLVALSEVQKSHLKERFENSDEGLRRLELRRRDDERE